MAARRGTLAATGIAGMLALTGGVALAGTDSQSEPEGKAGPFTYRSASVEFAGAGEAAAACPQGKRVTGGGASLDGSTVDASIGAISPDSVAVDISSKRGFSARASITGLGQTLKVIAICAKRDGLVYRTKEDLFSTTGEAIELKKRCPNGTRVAGGGFVNGGTGDELLVSAPFDGNDPDSKPDDGWEGKLIPTGTAEVTTLTAICAESLKLSYETASESGSSPITEGVSCDTDTDLSGGGHRLTGEEGGVHASSPSDIGDVDDTPADGWLGEATFTGTQALTVYAICAG